MRKTNYKIPWLHGPILSLQLSNLSEVIRQELINFRSSGYLTARHRLFARSEHCTQSAVLQLVVVFCRVSIVHERRYGYYMDLAEGWLGVCALRHA